MLRGEATLLAEFLQSVRGDAPRTPLLDGVVTDGGNGGATGGTDAGLSFSASPEFA